MTLLRPCPIHTSRLNYNAAERTFSEEASTIGAPGRVYDDACDVGYTLVSARTGREVVFAETFTRYDNEGDIVYWVYEPEPYQRRLGELAGVRLIVFND
jgi:hypothetical protein